MPEVTNFDKLQTCEECGVAFISYEDRNQCPLCWRVNKRKGKRKRRKKC